MGVTNSNAVQAQTGARNTQSVDASVSNTTQNQAAITNTQSINVGGAADKYSAALHPDL
jgi:hypothetical protein